MKQNLTTVVEHTVKSELEKLGLEQGLMLSQFVRKILEDYLHDHKNPNKLVESIKVADEQHKEKVRTTKWVEITNPDGTVDLVESKDA